MNYTDTQLKQALAKMLPEKVRLVYAKSGFPDLLYWDSPFRPVLDTELLHLCWLVEQSLFPGTPLHDDYLRELKQVCDPEGCGYASSVGATWQQRIIALDKVAKAKGIKIV